MKHEELESAYNDAVIGKNAPDLMAVRGSVILKQRPDLEGIVEPDRVYYVTPESITLVEE